MSPDRPGTVLAGRVLAVLHPGRIVLRANGVVSTIDGVAHDHAPGDLVRVEIQGDRCVRDERVFRPLRAPWGADTESARIESQGLHERLHLRQRALRAVRAHFDSEQFLEVETPVVATSPGLDLHLHAYESRAPGGSLAGYLITSPEYHMKRLLAGGVPRCFQFARCFRAEEHGRRHEPEFTMLEWYRAWAGFEDLIRDTESVVRAAASVANEPGVLRHDGRAIDVSGPFERVTVREAFARYAPEAGDPMGLLARDEEAFFTTIVEKIEPRLGRTRPTFLYRYPAAVASLARLADDDPTVCERAELYVDGVELCNGFVELTDPVEQRERLGRDQRERAARGLPVYPIDERFLRALEEGMPPSVGNAVGFDRLVMLVAGAESIADVIAFPDARR